MDGIDKLRDDFEGIAKKYGFEYFRREENGGGFG